MTTTHNSGDLEAQTEARETRFADYGTAFMNDDGNDPTHEERRRETAEYGDSSATYWKLYLSEAEVSDQKLVETLRSDTTAISILNGIFSSIIASFLVQTSQALQPNNSSQETVCLLSQLVSQGSSTPVTQQSSQFCSDPSFSGAPSEEVIRSNILLLISFFLAMMSVLACGLIQQWCHEFMKYAYPRAAPHKRGRVRTYLLQGLNRFYIRRFMYAVHALLHISVFLFFGGISDYLHYLYPRVGMISWYCVITSVVVYAALSIFSLIVGNCPYQTALTPPLLFGSTLLLLFCRTAWRGLVCGPNRAKFPERGQRHFNKRRYLMEQVNANAAHLDPYAMKWLFTDNDFDDADMDKFLEGLPGYIQSHITIKEKLPEVLTAPYLLRRIREHIFTCATASELSEQARVKRVSACVDSLRVIHTSPELLKNPDEERLLRGEMQNIVDDFNTACGSPEEKRNLRAFCVRALLFQGFLTKCLEPSLERARSSDGNVPGHFISLHTFFSSVIRPQRPPQVAAGVSDDKELPLELPDNGEMWQDLLSDGPFINLTLLAKAILSREDTVTDPSTLSMCWKTLDILRSELRITRVDVCASSLAFFDAIHEQTRNRIEAEDFSVIPLLEVLDAVDGGRRLSMVFRDYPDHKYRKKADLVFGKDHLRNPDLFQAFANCLPHFVTNHPVKSTELMEGFVCYDHLWTSLQVHLSNSLQPNSYIPAMMRVFDTCCTVIDIAFVALENSQKVDWRSPEFGSLAHYFELFVTDCFQGMFIERAIGFRVGLIKARFCRGVLAQFLDEFRREGTVVFRSHWDVASLARIFYSLGVGDNDDVEFWKSFVDGGPVGEVLMAKTYTMLDTAERDGPLLNFCKLGYLGMMAVPFEGSGLTEADFKKLLDLLKKMTEDKLLPLTHASITVWENLCQLRDEVADTCERINGEDEEDKANMTDLLEKIDTVYRQRPSSVQGHPLADHAQTQVSGTSASTAITEDRHDSSPTQEIDSRGVTQARSKYSRGEFANVYRNPYPHLPSQIDHTGAITRPFSASFLPNLFPHVVRTDIRSSGIPSAQRSIPHIRYNSQHHRSSVYYPPRVDTPNNRSATLLSLRSPARILSNPSDKGFGPSSSNVVCSSPSVAPPADEIE